MLSLLLAAGSASAQKGAWALQTASFTSQAEAEEKTRQMKRQGQDAYIVKSNVLGQGIRYRVRIGRFASKPDAQAYGDKLKREGIIADYYAAPFETPLRAAPASPAPAPPAIPAVNGKGGTPGNGTAVTPAATSSVASPPPATSAPASPGGRPGKVNVKQPSGRDAAAALGKSATSAAAAKTTKSVTIAGFQLYEDKEVGFAFQHPITWIGAAWSKAEISSQNIDAGASFKSREDAAFLNAIWNRLEAASDDTRYDNTLLVDTILKSMGSGGDTQKISEVSRKVEKSGTQIKTYLELMAFFRDPNSSGTLNFNGKALITRCQNGILLVVVFYSAEAPPATAAKAGQIIQSVRAPE